MSQEPIKITTAKQLIKTVCIHLRIHTSSLYIPHDEILLHYGDVIVGTMASDITSRTLVYSTVLSGANKKTHQSSALLAFVRRIHGHRWIPGTKASKAENFHLMTSPWLPNCWCRHSQHTSLRRKKNTYFCPNSAHTVVSSKPNRSFATISCPYWHITMTW